MRTPESLDAAKRATRFSNIESSVSGLPPGYMEGFNFSLTDKRLTIGPGVANVMGYRVSTTGDTIISESDWDVPKINNTEYFIYIDHKSVFHVDNLEPEYNATFFSYYHPYRGYKNIGRIYVASGQIQFVQYKTKAEGNVLVVAPSTFTGEGAHYYCDGTDDQNIIHLARDYAYNAWGGGIIHLMKGTYYTSAQIVHKAGIIIEGEGIATVIEKNHNGHGFSAIGTSGNEITNIGMRNLKITKHADDVYATQSLVYWDYVDLSFIHEVIVDGAKQYGIALTRCDYIEIFECRVINNEGGGIYTTNSATAKAKTRIVNCHVNDNDAWGMFLSNMEGSIIQGNICDGNGNAGIYCTDVNNATIANNECTNNGASGLLDGGIVLDGDSDENIVSGNNCEGNSDFGISLNDSAQNNNLVNGNYCKNNGSDTGIDNDNAHNFSNNGTTTAVHGNSWQAQFDVPIGCVLLYAGAGLPHGFLFCDGSSLLRAGKYADLYAAIGTAWGTADGTHFNIPETRGYFARFVAHGSAGDPDRAARVVINAGGNTGDNVGSAQLHEVLSHYHTINPGSYVGVSAGGGVAMGNVGTTNVTSYGGNETRGRNVYFEAIIKYK